MYSPLELLIAVKRMEPGEQFIYFTGSFLERNTKSTGKLARAARLLESYNIVYLFMKRNEKGEIDYYIRRRKGSTITPRMEFYVKELD